MSAEEYKKEIIKMVQKIKFKNMLQYIYVIVKPIYEKAERSE